MSIASISGADPKVTAVGRMGSNAHISRDQELIAKGVTNLELSHRWDAVRIGPLTDTSLYGAGRELKFLAGLKPEELQETVVSAIGDKMQLTTYGDIKRVLTLQVKLSAQIDKLMESSSGTWTGAQSESGMSEGDRKIAAASQLLTNLYKLVPGAVQAAKDYLTAAERGSGDDGLTIGQPLDPADVHSAYRAPGAAGARGQDSNAAIALTLLTAAADQREQQAEATSVEKPAAQDQGSVDILI